MSGSGVRIYYGEEVVVKWRVKWLMFSVYMEAIYKYADKSIGSI